MEKEFLLKRNGLSIPVKVTTPDFGDIRRVVLGVHGLGGSTEDAIQQAMAEEMEMFYSATVRFDLPAHGKNEETELLLDSCLDTLYAVAAGNQTERAVLLVNVGGEAALQAPEGVWTVCVLDSEHDLEPAGEVREGDTFTVPAEGAVMLKSL